MRSQFDSTGRDPTSTPAFWATFLLEFVGHEADIEALRSAGAALGRSVSRLETPTPEKFSRSLAGLVGSELEEVAGFLDRAVTRAHEGAWPQHHPLPAYRMARISELVPQLHSLAVLVADLESPARQAVAEWEPDSAVMGEGAALEELRRRFLRLARTLRFQVSSLRRLCERLPASAANGHGAEGGSSSLVMAIQEALDVVIFDRLASTIATLETAGEIDNPEWREDPERYLRVLAECDPSWPVREASLGPRERQPEDPVASLRSGARVLVRQLEDQSAYLRSKLSAVPLDHPDQPVLAAQVDEVVGALGDAVVAMEPATA